MDDIGNLLYIIIFVIWVLYRAFGKSGKKPGKPTAPGQSRPTGERGPTEATPPPVTFEDILRELTGTPTGPPEPQPEVIEEVLPTSSEEYYAEPEEKTSFEVLEPVEIPQKPVPPPEWRFKEFEVKQKKSSKAARAALKAFRSKHGARQAFIMKEIFDRKY